MSKVYEGSVAAHHNAVRIQLKINSNIALLWNSIRFESYCQIRIAGPNAINVKCVSTRVLGQVHTVEIKAIFNQDNIFIHGSRQIDNRNARRIGKVDIINIYVGRIG